MLTTSQLNQLAYHHPTLSPLFGGTFPCDGLPDHPPRERDEGYIVNTDPAGEPGRHWLGLWVSGNACELFDSFALDLDTYETTAPLKTWLRHQFKYVTQNGQSVQSLHNQSCGGYALMFLVAKSQGQSLSEFQKQWSRHDYVANDHRVGQWVKDSDHERTSLAEGSADYPRRSRHVSIERGRASFVLRSIVLRALINFEIKRVVC